MSKEDLKKAYRSEKDLKIRARILAVHMVSVCEESIGKTATNLMQPERWMRDWLKRYDEGGLNGLRDLLRLGLERRTGAAGSGRRIEGMRCDAQRHGCPTCAHLHCQRQTAGLLPIQDGAGIGEPCSLYIDGKQPKAEQRELERGEGSKTSQICRMDSIRSHQGTREKPGGDHIAEMVPCVATIRTYPHSEPSQYERGTDTEKSANFALEIFFSNGIDSPVVK